MLEGDFFIIYLILQKHNKLVYAKKRRVLPAVIPIRLHLHTARYAQGGRDSCQYTDDDVDDGLPRLCLDFLTHGFTKLS